MQGWLADERLPVNVSDFNTRGAGYVEGRILVSDTDLYKRLEQLHRTLITLQQDPGKPVRVNATRRESVRLEIEGRGTFQVTITFMGPIEHDWIGGQKVQKPVGFRFTSEEPL